MSLLSELKRRNVFRVAAAYLVLSWLLLQVADLLLPAFGAPDWVLRVLVLVLCVGLVATVVFSWAYELTPEGLKREHEVDRDASIAQATGRKLDIAVIVLLVVAIGVALFTRLGSTPQAPIAQTAPTETPAPSAPSPPADARPSLAVLPFVNMSAVAENEYFSDGLTETLLNMLAQVEGLKVTARTSSFAFKGQNKDVREIAATLDVRAILEGSVQRAGDRVRITAQLIDASDGKHLWSQSYDRQLDDLFAIQDEIAAAVAKELTRSLLGNAGVAKTGTVGTHDTDAYDAYLRGLDRRWLLTFGALADAERHFKQALARDPGFSNARIALAGTYARMANTGAISGAEAAERGRAVLQPLLGGANADANAQALAAVLDYRGNSDLERDESKRAAAEAVVVRALDQFPNNVELYLSAAHVKTEKQAAEALAVLERGLLVDPLSVELKNLRARRLVDLGREDEALAEYARLRELAPDSVFGTQGPMRVYERRGDFANMLYWCAQAAVNDPDDHELPAFAAQYLLMMGLVAEAEPWVRRAELINASGSDTRRVAIQYAEQSGDRERAIALSRDVLRERRDNRRFVYGIAVIYYLTLMHEAGKLDEALAFIEKVSPGATATELPNAELEMDMTVQGLVASFLAPRESLAQRKARAARLRSYVARLNPDTDLDHNISGAILKALEGDPKGAAPILAHVLLDPRQQVWEWRVSVLRDPLLGELTRDPVVADAITKAEALFAEHGKRYREMVAKGEIVVP